jgi:hypothetical protein
MHRDDEAMFVRFLLEDGSVVLIDGPRWKNSTPVVTRNLTEIKGNYCIVWSKANAPRLRANYISACDDWYCRNEEATLQFLRSQELGGLEITEGRLAVCTPDFETKSFTKEGIAGVEKRFKSARSFLKKHFTNNAIRWFLPGVVSGPNASPNPSKPDPSVWVGPFVKTWLEESKDRKLRQFEGGRVEAIIVGNHVDG